MAGYVRKLAGYVYDGVHDAGEELENGMFVEITPAGVQAVTAAKDTKMRVEEKTSLWGLPALVLDVTSVGTDEVYFTEQDWGNQNGEEWDETENKVKPGEMVRMKRLLPGEQVIMTVDGALFASLNLGDIVAPAAGGTVAI